MALGVTYRRRRELLVKWKRQGKGCAYCPAPADTLDHVVPLIRGGTNWEGNLAPCCRSCNGSKAGLLISEWRTGRRCSVRQYIIPTPRVSPVKAVKIKPTPKAKDCPICAATFSASRKYCSNICGIEANARINRERYRAKVGLPPTWDRATWATQTRRSAA